MRPMSAQRFVISYASFSRFAQHRKTHPSDEGDGKESPLPAVEHPQEGDGVRRLEHRRPEGREARRKVFACRHAKVRRVLGFRHVVVERVVVAMVDGGLFVFCVHGGDSSDSLQWNNVVGARVEQVRAGAISAAMVFREAAEVGPR